MDMAATEKQANIMMPEEMAGAMISAAHACFSETSWVSCLYLMSQNMNFQILIIYIYFFPYL